MFRQLEVLIHGLGHNDLAASSRVLLRQDLVTTSSSPWIRKDRCLFLFNDILLITTVSRRGTKDIKRSLSSLPSSLPAVLEMCRHKLWMYLTLSDVDICKAKEESLKKLLKEYRYVLVQDRSKACFFALVHTIEVILSDWCNAVLELFKI